MVKSVLIAGVIGAVLLMAVQYVTNQTCSTSSSPGTALATGFAVGAGVQIGVRVLEIS